MENALYNLNIERAILSSILFEPSLFEVVASEAKAEVFYLPAHQHIFNAMEKLSNSDTPIDEEFIRKTLEKEKLFNEEAMLDILATNPLSNTTAYLAEIRDLYLKRELIRMTTEIKQVIYEEHLDAPEALDRVQKRLFEVGVDTSNKQFRESEEIVHATLAQIAANKERGNDMVIGLDTGFFGLNKKTSGLMNGDLIIIAARPSMGKTAFILNLASNILNKNEGVAFFSLEMPAEQLMLRMLSSRTGVPLQKIKLGNMEDSEMAEVSAAADFFSSSKFFADDDGMLTLHKLRSKLRRLKMKHPEVSLAIIDYLQLMSGSSNKDRHVEVSEISRGIKMLARELNMPIIALSQLNRGVESRNDKRPMLADIRESGAIEQDADIIMFIYREDVYKAREEREKQKKAEAEDREYKNTFVEKPVEDAEIIIAKHRNGEVGTVNMQFRKACVRFEDKEGHEAQTTYYKDTNVILEVDPPVDMPKVV